MKTKNNVQKTILSTSAVIVSLVLISFTVTAQDFWKMVITNSSFNEIALAMADTREKPKSQPISNETWSEKLLPVEEEQNLSIENWMKEPTFNNASLQLNATETESSLNVEDWMVTETGLNTKVESEMPLFTEGWMYNEKLWTR